jgi:hypothetical protein
MKTLLHKLSGGEINIHAITFWITLALSILFFTLVISMKFL